MIRIGTLIRRWRTMEGLTLDTVSQDIGVHLATLQRLETGDGEVSGETLARVITWALVDPKRPSLALRNRRRKQRLSDIQRSADRISSAKG